MNNFNEDLRLKVISDLGTLEKDVNDKNSKTVDSQVTYNLSGGKELSIQEAVNTDKTKVASSQVIVGQAANSSSISKNIQSSVALQTGSMTTTVANSAQAASDIKSAAAAITKLSADIGGISNTLRAIDDTSEMSEQAIIVNRMFLKLSNDMEGASLEALKMAADMAGAIKEKVASSATSTDTAVTNLLTGVTADYDTRSAQLTADEAALAGAKSGKKGAYGDFKDNEAYLNSSRSSYNFTDKELNHDLRAESFMPKPEAGKFLQPGNNLRFNQVQFEVDSLLIPAPEYVENYCVFLVKTAEIGGFTLGQAQKMFTIVSDKNNLDNKPGILVNPADNYIDIHGITTNSYSVKTSSNGKGQVTYELEQTTADGAKATTIILNDGFNNPVDLKDDYRLVILTTVIPKLTQDYGVEPQSLTAWSAPFNYMRPMQIPHVIEVKDDVVSANYKAFFPDTTPTVEARLILLPGPIDIEGVKIDGKELLKATETLIGALKVTEPGYKEYAGNVKKLETKYKGNKIWAGISKDWAALNKIATESSNGNTNSINNAGNLEKHIKKNSTINFAPITENKFATYPGNIVKVKDLKIKFDALDKFIDTNKGTVLEGRLLTEFEKKCSELSFAFKKSEDVFNEVIVEVNKRSRYIHSMTTTIRIDKQFGDPDLFDKTGVLYDDYIASTISDLTYLKMEGEPAVNTVFKVEIKDDSKDFFGNYVIKGASYIPTVLIVATESKNYDSSLAWEKSAFVKYKTPKQEKKIEGTEDVTDDENNKQ